MFYSSREWKDKSVLVTGATGMLGQSVVQLLRNATANVTALVRSASSCPQSCKALVCDITDSDALSGQLQSSSFDFVLHLAAQSQVGGEEATATFQSNISGTLHLLEAVRTSNPNATLILASTDGASGCWGGFKRPLAEIIDIGPYAASKMCAEILAHCYASSFGLSVGIARLTNLYGPYDRNLRRLVPGTICSVLQGQEPSFRSSPATPINFLYVDDAAEAILFLAEQVAGGRTTLRTVTVRSQKLMTLGEMVDAILTCMGRSDLRPKSVQEDDAMGGSPASTPIEVGEDWGWRPHVSLEEGLKKTISWYQQKITE